MMASNVHWVVDDAHTERSVNGSINDALKELNISHYIGKYIPFQDEQDYGTILNVPTVLYGSINYIKKCKTSFIPGAYINFHNLECKNYYSYIPNEWLLNGNYVMVPFYKIKETMELLDLDYAFVRPNSGIKTFTGFVVDKNNLDFEMKSTISLSSTLPETLCLVSPAVNIQSEFRFLIGNREVIDGSEYRWNNVLDIRHDWDNDCYDLANKMAKHSWQPDLVYVCDVGMTDEGPKIVELNGFSCAGLYAMDKKLVVDRVSKIAYDDFHGNI